MNGFWIIAVPIFLIVIAVVAKFTLKKFRKESDDREWRLWAGIYQLAACCSL